MRNPLVSVVVPVYNVEKYISQCIESIINQTYINLEIIIVIDGSTDRSEEICESYKKMDTRIKIIRQRNQGLSAARNTGILSARGELICFVDSDDFIKIEMIEKMVDAKLKYNAQMVIAGIIRYHSDEEYYNISVATEKAITAEEVLESILTDDIIGNYSWNKLYDRTLFENILFPENKVYEDVYTIYKVISKCKRLYVLSDSFYFYRQRRGSLTHRPSLKAFDDQLEGFITQAYWILEKFPTLEIVCEKRILKTYLRMFDTGAAWKILDTNRLKCLQQGAINQKKYYDFLSGKEKIWFAALTRFPYIYMFLRPLHFKIKHSKNK